MDRPKYGMLYMMGCIIAFALALGRHDGIQDLVVHTLFSWGYVVYYVLFIVR